MSKVVSSSPAVFALVGNPNCGKTTLFNALTGLRQKVGNYPGVTVEKKVGTCVSPHGEVLQILDLPGTYSLTPRSPDEAITRDVLLGFREDTKRPDVAVCIVDASNLERNLYLFSQVLDAGLPVILVLNMIDLAEANGLKIDLEVLREKLGVPVVAAQANSGKGLIELRQAMAQAPGASQGRHWRLPDELEKEVEHLASQLAQLEVPEAEREAWRLLAEGQEVTDRATRSKAGQLVQQTALALQQRGVNIGEEIVGARYAWLQEICQASVHSIASPGAGASLSDRLDAVLVHPFWGWLCFGGVMGLMFLSIFTLAQYPMNWITAFFTSLGEGVKAILAPGDFRDLLTDGILSGVGSVVVFLPQILILFFFIGLLEDTGYMARAAFIMDRVMSRVGLHGKSFIPLLSSYACAIPGIMATRTIENPQDRLVTILVAPFMSCSARLPVYTLMIATIFPENSVPLLAKVGIMLLMYFLGTAGAFFFAWLFKQTLMRGERTMFLMELPPYRLPVVGHVGKQMMQRAGAFLTRAGTVILGLSILLWALCAYPKTPGVDAAGQLSHSYAGQMGKLLEPMIRPLGFDWKIGIGLVASFAAREVFVSTMAIVYNVQGGEDAVQPLRDALLHQKWPDGHLIFSPLSCLGLLVFYVYALQCLSTVAVVRRETLSWKWPLFQLVYMTGFAYGMALLIHQVGLYLGYR